MASSRMRSGVSLLTELFTSKGNVLPGTVTQREGGSIGGTGVAPSPARRRRWRHKIERGQARSVKDLAAAEGVTDAYICRLLPFTRVQISWRPSSTGGCRKGCGWRKYWGGIGRARGRSERVGASSLATAV